MFTSDNSRTENKQGQGSSCKLWQTPWVPEIELRVWGDWSIETHRRSTERRQGQRAASQGCEEREHREDGASLQPCPSLPQLMESSGPVRPGTHSQGLILVLEITSAMLTTALPLTNHFWVTQLHLRTKCRNAKIPSVQRSQIYCVWHLIKDNQAACKVGKHEDNNHRLTAKSEETDGRICRQRH